MKKVVLLIVLLPIVSRGLAQSSGNNMAQSPGNSLSGIVTDSADGKPLPGVSIFLNSTSKGTISREDGSFLLKEVPRGRYDLIVSAIGYETFVLTVSGAQLPANLTIMLRRKAAELAAVTVEPFEKDGWRLYGKYFLDNFIGMVENSRGCTIKNRSTLRFHFYKKSNRLSVTAVEPLIIENDALGYAIQFKLETFVSDFNSHIITYYGYPYFQQMSTTKEGRRRRWEQHRQLVLQWPRSCILARSLYASHTREEGFILEQQQIIPNLEKRRVKTIYRANAMQADTFAIDTLHHFWEVLRQPDFFGRTIIVPPDSLLTIYPDQGRSLFFNGLLNVLYREGKNGNYRRSQLKLVTPALIQFEENGNYYPPQEILASGSWGQTEKIANLLPLDYGQR